MSRNFFAIMGSTLPQYSQSLLKTTVGNPPTAVCCPSPDPLMAVTPNWMTAPLSAPRTLRERSRTAARRPSVARSPRTAPEAAGTDRSRRRPKVAPSIVRASGGEATASAPVAAAAVWDQINTTVQLKLPRTTAAIQRYRS